ncbi:MAG: tRNA-dependent cyclodipeptide synthase [Ignavibacteriae bacterium]|nr:tRNA-dependent cyclodipeptide synthase [Ignavibacteriota bacterium]
MGSAVKKNIEFKIKKVVPSFKKDEIRFRQRCYTGISISNPFFSGDLVVPFFKWILRNFKFCCIFIDDYFHKYNEMSFSGKSEAESLKIAKKRGVEIEEHINGVIKKTFDDAYRFKIVKSSDLSKSDNFKRNKKIFSDLFNENSQFKSGINKSSSDYIKRQLKRGNHFLIDRTEVLQNCNNYLIDEIAIFTTICELGYTVEVYPGPELPVLVEIANGVYDNIPEALVNRINVELKLKK